MGIYRDIKSGGNFTYDRSSHRIRRPEVENKAAATRIQEGRGIFSGDVGKNNLAALRKLKDDSSIEFLMRGPEEPDDEELPGEVSFEPTLLSPYALSLDGQEYDPLLTEGPSGLCPLCNNTRHAEYDALLMNSLDEPSKWRSIPFTRQVIERHLALHVLPVYTLVGEAACLSSSSAPPPRGGEDDRHGTRAVSHRLIASVKRMIAHSERAPDLREEEELAESGQIRLAALEAIMPPCEPVEEHEPTPSVHMAPKGAKAKSWYAFDGNRCQGALRLWGEGRMGTEIEKRASEAIVFYDEMVEARAMAHRIYGEIMDTDIEEANRQEEIRAADEGKRPKYIERNYSAAIQAVKLKKEIATDMARLALIAQKFGDEEDRKGKPLSPAVRSILDDLGLGPMRQALPDAEEDEAVL